MPFALNNILPRTMLLISEIISDIISIFSNCDLSWLLLRLSPSRSSKMHKLGKMLEKYIQGINILKNEKGSHYILKMTELTLIHKAIVLL